MDLRERFEEARAELINIIGEITHQVSMFDPGEARRYDAYNRAQLEPEDFALFQPTDSLTLQVREMLDVLDGGDEDEPFDSEAFAIANGGISPADLRYQTGD